METWTLTPGLDETSRWAFIVGAPRCGTTSMSEYLRDHPEVCFSEPKEPHFFAIRDRSGRPTDELKPIVERKYLNRYFRDRRDASLFAEGSVSYFYAPERLEPALRLWPRAKFIIMLRNPLDMVPSLHQRVFYNGDDNVRSFEKAWRLVPERRAGRSIPRSCLDPRFLDYWEAGQLGKHLEKFLSTIGRDRCLISLFDDFERDPGAEYRRMLNFLDLPDDGRKDFGTHGGARDCRIAWIHRLMKRPPKAVIWLFDRQDSKIRFEDHSDKPSPVLEAVLKIRTRIINWNKVPASRPVVSDELRAEMRGMYRDDVELLSRLIGRDLSHWMAEPS